VPVTPTTHLGAYFVFIFLCVLSAAAHAGEIQGLVRNAQGAGISGAKVTVTNQQEDAHWEAV